ncbi:MAG: hypothetical protein ABI587_10290 [Gemmatimonadales bacterium]
MTRVLGVVMAGVGVLLSGAKDERPAPVAAPPVAQIEDVTLRDVAVAVYDPEHSVIYYNPVLLRRLGPDLTQFFMAHERAHIALRHTRSGALGTGVDQRNRALQQKELAADCLATRTLGVAHRGAAEAAVRFFARIGTRQFDREHPTGAARAANILSCLPSATE